MERQVNFKFDAEHVEKNPNSPVYKFSAGTRTDGIQVTAYIAKAELEGKPPTEVVGTMPFNMREKGLSALEQMRVDQAVQAEVEERMRQLGIEVAHDASGNPVPAPKGNTRRSAK